MPLKRYADFKGRSRRKEYWMFALFIALVYLALLIIGFALAGGGDDGLMGGVMGILFLVFILGIFVPAIAVQVRRFHDQGKSGWMVLLGFIPLVGGIIVLVFMCLEGDKGPNEYGPDPKGNEADVFT